MKLVTLATLLGIIAGAANAGTIVLSADGNIANAVVGSGGSTLPNDNDTFFANVLGGGTEVRILPTTGSGSPSLADADTDLNSFYGGLGGVTSSLIAGPVTAAALAGVNLFVVVMPDGPFSASEVGAMSGLVGSGGTLFLMGDNNSFAAGNAAVNAALAALGSSMSIVNDSIDAGFHAGTPLPHPLTGGVAQFEYAATSLVQGGTPLFLTSSGRKPFVAVEAGAVPEPGTLALVAAGVGLCWLGRRRH